LENTKGMIRRSFKIGPLGKIKKKLKGRVIKGTKE
jgi:hypothetical protein